MTHGACHRRTVTHTAKMGSITTGPHSGSVSGQVGWQAKARPQTHLQRSLAMAWCQVLGMLVDLDTDFFMAGGTLADETAILGRVRQLTGRDLPLRTLVTYPTVRRLAGLLEGSSDRLRWKNLVEVRAAGDHAPVVCVHFDEGNYHAARLLSEDHPLFAFFHQGEDGMPMEHRSFPSIAKHYAEELAEALPAGPVVVCGYSYGGDIALELARQLLEAGRDVPLLVLLDSRSPLTFRGASDKPWYVRLRDIRNRMRCTFWFNRGLPLPHGLRIFHIMDVYGKAMHQYRPGPWRGRTLLIRSEARNARPHQWDTICTDLHTVVVPGDHRSIISGHAMEQVMEVMRKEMDELGL